MSELKNQELPALTISFGAQGEAWIATNMPSIIQAAPVRVEKYVPEFQLLAARNELKAKDTELAAKDARIAELTVLSGKMLLTGQRALDRLGAVSEVLKEKLPTSPWYPEFCRLEDFNAFVAKARSIVEGK